MPRSTLEFKSVVDSWSNKYWYASTGSVTSSDQGNTTWGAGSRGVCPMYRTYTGTVTPNYRTLKKQGDLPINSYTMDLVTVSCTAFTVTNRYYDDMYKGVNSWGATRYTFAPDALGVDQGQTQSSNKAMQKLGANCSAVKFNAAQFLAERKQTAELLASTAHRIVSAARALRRGRLGDFAQSLSLSGTEYRTAKSSWRRVMRTEPSKRVASHWLEYVYGWKPLLQDAHDAAELLAERIREYDYSVGRIVGTGKSVNNYPNCAAGWKIDIDYTTITRYIAHYRLDDASTSMLAQTGISNPALLAWELLPYSFVIDWFLPVGSYLEALTSFDGFTLIRGSKSTLTKGQMRIDLSYGAWKQWNNSTKTYDYHSPSGNVVKNHVHYTRIPISSWPSYVLQVKSPIGGSPVQRALTALALMKVVFS